MRTKDVARSTIHVIAGEAAPAIRISGREDRAIDANQDGAIDVFELDRTLAARRTTSAASTLTRAAAARDEAIQAARCEETKLAIGEGVGTASDWTLKAAAGGILAGILCLALGVAAAPALLLGALVATIVGVGATIIGAGLTQSGRDGAARAAEARADNERTMRDAYADLTAPR